MSLKGYSTPPPPFSHLQLIKIKDLFRFMKNKVLYTHGCENFLYTQSAHWTRWWSWLIKTVSMDIQRKFSWSQSTCSWQGNNTLWELDTYVPDLQAWHLHIQEIIGELTLHKLRTRSIKCCNNTERQRKRLSTNKCIFIKWQLEPRPYARTLTQEPWNSQFWKRHCSS